MGAHRFTNVDLNLVVAATDLPDDDRQKQESQQIHYSKTQDKYLLGVYGEENVYVDNVKANEDIKFYMDSQVFGQ